MHVCVYGCMDGWMYVCLCVCASACLRVHARARLCLRIFTHTHAHTHTHTHAQTHTHTHTPHVYICVHASPRRVGRYNYVPGEYICVTNTGSIRAGIKARTAPHRTGERARPFPSHITQCAAQRSGRAGGLALSHGTVCEQPGPIVAADVDAIVPFDNEARA
jgi:hypothetical protein